MNGKELAEFLKGTPCSMDGVGQLNAAAAAITEIEERVVSLRGEGTISETALRAYFGDKRYEQVAESNAIEGSTLNVGETALAIEKGVTLGKEPAYVRDAVALNKALSVLIRMAEARGKVTDSGELIVVHAELLKDQPGAGAFRRERVTIKGADHKPPMTHEEIRLAMLELEAWSQSNTNAPTLLRATVLHAWITHVHPFIDGNGRTARAISTLEFVRGGYPVAIIPNSRRSEYLESLAESDRGGDISPFLEMMHELANDALTACASMHQDIQV